MHGCVINVAVFQLATSKVVKDGKISSHNGIISSKMTRDKICTVIHDFFGSAWVDNHLSPMTCSTEMFVVKIMVIKTDIPRTTSDSILNIKKRKIIPIKPPCRNFKNLVTNKVCAFCFEAM